MNHPRIDKDDLQHVLNLHTQAISVVPMNHPIYPDLQELIDRLQERLDTYDEFEDNPYKTHTSLPKFNSDKELNLGEYDATE